MAHKKPLVVPPKGTAHQPKQVTRGFSLADPYFPSTQLCSACGTKPTEKLKLSTRKWTCGNCGTTHQRDHNAAMNLKLLADVMLEQCQLGVHPGQLHLTKSYEHYVPQVVKHTYRRTYGKEACGDRVQ